MLLRISAAALLAVALLPSSLAAQVNAPTASDPPTAAPTAVDTCKAKVIDAQVRAHADRADAATSDHSDLMADLDSGRATGDVARVARCLYNLRMYKDALAVIRPAVVAVGTSGSELTTMTAEKPLVWQVYAIVLDKLGQRAAAKHAITVAINFSQEGDSRAEPSILRDYERLTGDRSRETNDAEKAAIVDRANNLAASRRFWDACSPDQRRILVMRGGARTNRDHNVGDHLGPHRITTYETANYREETWWYYGGLGTHSAEAFTFRNGRLVSHYQG